MFRKSDADANPRSPGSCSNLSRTRSTTLSANQSPATGWLSIFRMGSMDSVSNICQLGMSRLNCTATASQLVSAKASSRL